MAEPLAGPEKKMRRVDGVLLVKSVLILQMKRTQPLGLQIGRLSREAKRLTGGKGQGEQTNEKVKWKRSGICVGVKTPIIQLLDT